MMVFSIYFIEEKNSAVTLLLLEVCTATGRRYLFIYAWYSLSHSIRTTFEKSARERGTTCRYRYCTGATCTSSLSGRTLELVKAVIRTTIITMVDSLLLELLSLRVIIIIILANSISH